jgi:hypothetical protein
MRAGDADREVVLERLRIAHAEGRLDLDELDERVAATLAARTYGELAALTADLPGEPPTPRPLGAPAQGLQASPTHAEESSHDMRSALAGWAGVSMTVFVLWIVTSIISGGPHYPWFLWVVGPWGAVLLAAWIGSRLRDR